MISDVLSDAVEEIKTYLLDPLYRSVYSDPEIHKDIQEVLEKMEALRAKLDAPPPSWMRPQP